jgi:hypothetical protein
VKPIGMCRALRQGWFTGSDEDGGAQTNIAASGAQLDREPVRERNLKNGEAPVKYELTGASATCEPKLAVWRRPIKCLLGPLGNRWSYLFLVIGVS